MIYRLFFEKFSLNPEECLFIDDLKRNIDASRAEGMEGYVFDGDVKKLRAFLGL
jgi:putative hydrolase of the HAD superfamily